MKRDLIFSCLGDGLAFICGLFVFKLAARNFGPVGFGEYTLARKAVSFLLPVLLIGLGVGLTRYIAISGSSGKVSRVSYIVAGYGSVMLLSLLALLSVNAFPGFFGKLVYGKPGYDGLIRSMSMLSEAYVINALVFVYYRGKGSFISAITLNFMSLGVAPLVAFLFSGSVQDILELTALLIFLLTCIYLFPILNEVTSRWSEVEIIAPLKELMRYGLARMPGDICLAGIFSLPALLTAHLYGVKEAGYVGFGVSLVFMTGAVFGPIGFIMLPKLSSMLSEGRERHARAIMKKIVKYSVFISIGITLLVIIFAEGIVALWLGRDFIDSVGIIRLVVLAAVPYSLFVALKSSIDAAYEKAINAGNLYKALAASAVVYLIASSVRFSGVSIPFSFVFGMAVLGFLTIRASMSTYGLKVRWVFDAEW